MVLRDTNLMDRLWEKTRTHLTLIEEGLRRELDRHQSSRFHGPLLYAVEGGKRVRPLVTLLSAEAAGGPVNEALQAAVAVELLHTESIIHDDIIDQEAVRRERMAFHVKYGYGASLLTADFILGMVLDVASRYADTRVAKELSRAALRMSEGEFGELKIDPKVYQLSWNEYIALASQKTAALFETAGKVGAIIGRGTEQGINALAAYGLELGIAFQLHDDILDWGQEGKVTAALRLEAMDRDPLSYLRDMAQAQAEKAKRALAALAATPARAHLEELADFAVTRSY
jgi:octaprenyl-diphosphate synthase